MADEEDLRSLPLIQRFSGTLRNHAPRRLRELRTLGRQMKKRTGRSTRLRGYPR